MVDVARFLKGADERQEGHTVYLSPDVGALTAATLASVAAAGGTLADPPPDQQDDPAAAAVDTAWAFHVAPLTGSKWQHLLDLHPPHPDHVAEAARVGTRVEFHLIDFPQAAIAACLRWATNPDGDRLAFAAPGWQPDGTLRVDPDAVALASQAWDMFPPGDFKILWGAVARLNGTEDRVKLSAQVQSFANGSTATRSGAR